MTVQELREILSRYNDDVCVYVRIEDIVTDYGFFEDSTAAAKIVKNGDIFDIRDGIVICGIE